MENNRKLAKEIVSTWAIQTLKVDLDYVTDQMREDFKDLCDRIAAALAEKDAAVWDKAIEIAAMPSPFTTESGLNDGWREASERIVLALEAACTSEKG